jgi:hypothetical protein
MPNEAVICPISSPLFASYDRARLDQSNTGRYW